MRDLDNTSNTDIAQEILVETTHGKKRTKAIKTNVISSFFLKGFSIGISFLLVPVTIDYVSPELYGIWLTLSSILTWLHFLDIGFTQGLKNKLTEAIANNDFKRGKSLVSTTYFMMTLIFVPVCVILELIIPIINWPSLLNVNPAYGAEIVKVMHVLILFVCLQMVINVIVSVVSAFQRVALSSSFHVIGQFLAFLIILALTKFFPPSLLALCFSLAAMPILVSLIASIILYSSKYKAISPSINCIRKDCVGDIFNLGYKFFIINIQVVVLYQSTNILISHVSSPLDVTAYNIAHRYLNVAMMAYTIITAPLWPAYTDAYVRKDFNWMKSVRNKMMKVYLLSVLACILMVVLSKPVYHMWIHERTEVPFIMTCMVALYVIVYCWMNLNGTLVVGMGTVSLETIVVLVGMLIHIPLSIFLSKFIGAYGVISSMIIINITYAIIFNIQVNKLLSGKAKGIWAR